MEQLSNKNTGDPLPAAEWNQVPKEEENVITNTGQALSSGDTNQLGKGIAQYVANGNFYTDSGAGNAYVLTQIGLKQVTPAYVDGMIIEFIPANTNTGSATVNVATLGVKNISNTSSGGEIVSGTRISMRYNLGSGKFEIFQTAAVPVTAGLVFGLNMSNAADADHDITIATGQAADSTNAFLMQLSAAMTKQIDAAWAVGNNAGGLFSGVVAADTWYYVFEIRKDSDGSIDIGFDISATAANKPGGYSNYRYIGSILTDGADNILGFADFEIGGGAIYREWDIVAVERSGASPNTTRNLLTVTCPINSSAMFTLYYANTYAWVKSTSFIDVAASATTSTLISPNGSVTYETQVDSNNQVAFRTDNTGSFDILCHGYKDRRL